MKSSDATGALSRYAIQSDGRDDSGALLLAVRPIDKSMQQVGFDG